MKNIQLQQYYTGLEGEACTFLLICLLFFLKPSSHSWLAE